MKSDNYVLNYFTNLHSCSCKTNRNRHLGIASQRFMGNSKKCYVIWRRCRFEGLPLSTYGNEPKFAEMSRWIRKYNRRNEMSTIGKNILSDPTSDGNFSTTDEISPSARCSSPVNSYEEFDRRAQQKDNSLTQTCPTCGGTGKLTKGIGSFFWASL